MEQGAGPHGSGILPCHSGTLISGMYSGCPINNPIPEWNDLVLSRPLEGGARPSAQDQQFPEFTRPRVRPAPCEGSACSASTAAGHDQEHEVSDHRQRLRSPSESAPASRCHRFRPVGLCAAAQLRRSHRHRSSVPTALAASSCMASQHEARDKKEAVLRRVKLLEDEGVTFKCNVNVGNRHHRAARKDSDAIIVATGATAARSADPCAANCWHPLLPWTSHGEHQGRARPWR